MTKFAHVLLLIVAVGAAARAQPFEPGYVVTGGDTLGGELALGTEIENASGVLFREGPEAEPVRFEADEASAFGIVAGRRYRRAEYPILSDLRRSQRVRAREERVAFARVVREGAVDLLALQVSPGEAVFYLHREGDLTGLYYLRDEIADDLGWRTRELPLYRQALTAVLGDECGSFPVPSDVPYAETALAQIIDAHNRCADPEYAVTDELGPQPERAGFPLRFEASLGFIVALDAEDSVLRSRLDTMTPRFAVGVEIPAPFDLRALRVVAAGELGREALHANLGVRLLTSVGPVKAKLGVGVLAGINLLNVRRPTLNGELLPATTGSYLELRLGRRSSGVELVVRQQRACIVAHVLSEGLYRIHSTTAGLSYGF